jgi:hypothetical protein
VWCKEESHIDSSLILIWKNWVLKVNFAGVPDIPAKRLKDSQNDADSNVLFVFVSATRKLSPDVFDDGFHVRAV